MSLDLVTDPRDRQRIKAAGFSRSVQELQRYLRCRGYAEPTISFYQGAAVHFAFWAVTKHVARSHVTDTHISRFLSRHLARCECPLAGVRQFHTVRAALQHFKTVLDVGRHGPRHREKPSGIDREVRRFDDHLRTTCGLQETTRTYRRRYIREFLRACFADGHVDGSRLVPTDLVRYVSQRAMRLTPGSAQVLASSLRSYLRFLQLRGICDDRLILAVPAPAHWTLATLPKALTDDQANRFLAAFDHGTPTGRRDYAIARCISDLGLRASEVAALRLEDIDWRSGTLRIVGNKSRHDDELPFTAAVGRAIVAYLREGRPKTAARHIFLRVRPPVGRRLTRHIMCNVIRRAAARAGMGDLVTGPRILRHTAATRMLRHGASIKDIADVLRHRSLDTTAIYTKVDLPRLATVAAPWPQEGRR